MSDSIGPSDGIAMASLTLLIGILGKLKAKGVLNGEEITDLIDEALLNIEQEGLPHGQGTAQRTYAVLSQVLSVVGNPSKPKPSQED